MTEWARQVGTDHAGRRIVWEWVAFVLVLKDGMAHLHGKLPYATRGREKVDLSGLEQPVGASTKHQQLWRAMGRAQLWGGHCNGSNDPIPDHDVLVGGFPARTIGQQRPKTRGLRKKGCCGGKLSASCEKEKMHRATVFENVDRLLKVLLHSEAEFAIMLASLRLGICCRTESRQRGELRHTQQGVEFFLGYKRTPEFRDIEDEAAGCLKRQS